MKKKIIICLLAIIIAIFATIELSISNFAKDTLVYNISLENDASIKEININDDVVPFDSSKDIVSLELSRIDDLKIDYEGELVVLDNNSNLLDDETGEGDGLFLHTISKKDVIIGSININSILYFVICFVLSVISISYISYFINRYKNKNESFKIGDIVLLSIAIFIIFMMLFYILLYILDVAVVVLPLAIISYIVFNLKNNIKDKKENLYAVLAIVFGITMIFVLPPFNAPDEYAHFVKSYTTSTINSDEGKTYLPISLESFYAKYGHDLLDEKMDFDSKSYFDDIMQEGNYNTLSEKEFVYTNTKYLKVVPYIPSIVVLFVLKLIGASPLVMSVFGRFISLIVMIIMYYLAIKNVPILKRVFFVICMLPIVLHQAVINQDYLTNATVILLIAMILKYRYENVEIRIKEIAYLSILGLIISCCKFGYFVFLFTVFLIPCRLFKNKKTAVIFKLLFVILPIIISFTGNVTITQSEDNIHYTIGYSLSHPIEAIKVFAKTFWQRAELDLFRGQFDGFGVSTKWNNGFISSVLYFIYILFFLSSEREDVKKLEKKTRIMLFVVAILLIGVVYMAMYLNWTNMGADVIDGLQPRYFTPAILCLSLAFANSLIEIDIKNREKLDTILMCVIYVCVFSTIILGFYA